MCRNYGGRPYDRREVGITPVVAVLLSSDIDDHAVVEFHKSMMVVFILDVCDLSFSENVITLLRSNVGNLLGQSRCFLEYEIGLFIESP